MTTGGPSDAIRKQMRQWERDFAIALFEKAGSARGLRCRIPPGQSLPALSWEGDPRGGYWVSAGLVHRGEGSHDLSEVAASLHYLREPEDGESPFERDEWPMSTRDIGSRDPGCVAALLVAAAKHHRATL
jgi:hypothetical protein